LQQNPLGLEQDDDFIVWSNTAINISLFARAIAKIAYCHAVLQYGLDGFRPLILPDIILGRSRATPYFVGAPLDEPPPPLEKGRRHLVEFTHLDANPMHPSNALGELRLIIANIRLFADSVTIQHGLPIYRVICGARSPAMIRTLKPVPQTSRVIVLYRCRATARGLHPKRWEVGQRFHSVGATPGNELTPGTGAKHVHRGPPFRQLSAPFTPFAML
jgi:hypothetical protein